VYATKDRICGSIRLICIHSNVAHDMNSRCRTPRITYKSVSRVPFSFQIIAVDTILLTWSIRTFHTRIIWKGMDVLDFHKLSHSS
jgi:hypothetical protein